jgi:hypothetical protein
MNVMNRRRAENLGGNHHCEAFRHQSDTTISLLQRALARGDQLGDSAGHVPIDEKGMAVPRLPM